MSVLTPVRKSRKSPGRRRPGRHVIWIGSALLASAVAAQAPAQEPAEPRVPTIKEVLELHRVGSPVTSPDGSAVVYARRSTDWDNNRLDAELWLAEQGSEPFQLTRTADGDSTDADWSPDGRWIAFLADRGHGRQVHLISPDGGEARPLTRVKGGIEAYRWGPDGSFLILRLRDPKTEQAEAQTKAFGRFFEEDRMPRPSHLWWLDVKAALEHREGLEIRPEPADEGTDGDEEDVPAEDEAAEDEVAEDDSPGDDDPKQANRPVEPADDKETASARRLTSGDFTVDDFDLSPDGASVVFSHRPERRITAFADSDLSVVQVKDGALRSLVDRAGPDASPFFSPDGKTVAWTGRGDDFAFYKNTRVSVVPADGGEPRVLTLEHDGNPDLVGWTPGGLLFLDWRRTERRLFALDPADGRVKILDHLPSLTWAASPSADGKTVHVYAQTPDTLAEIWRCRGVSCAPVTKTDAQVDGWALGRREIVRWPSRDGLEIEGVLYTPDGFDPKVPHPLLVVIHGGPAAVSYPDPLPGYVYPVVQWLGKGAVVLMPNYRGSDGYGEAFRSANVDRLGVADAWDVLSGVDHLVKQGFVDEERMGVMGWSQGGYISAFLATTSDRFQGISVGAGISNWTTYYANTDIPTFTRQYLSATPWDDPELYAETSPMTYIKQASTPTLIQHGENDRRVPIPNAYELYRGLRDMDVSTELIVYEDFGHGIGRPKERLAAALHNWRWFEHTVWGEPLDLHLTEVETDSE